MARLIAQGLMAAALAVAGAYPACAGPDLSLYTPVLIEDFDGPLNRFDGVTGVWRDYPRREKYIGNGPPSLYVNPTMLREDGTPLGLNPFTVANGHLSISAAPIPANTLGDVHSLLLRAGYKAAAADKVRYYSGSLSTRSSWAQTYGYFEMRARLPEGRGHWPAFWLVSAVDGWPPEIDIFEVLGRENGARGSGAEDNLLHLRVHFDEIAANGTPAPDPVRANRFDLEGGEPQPAIERKGPKGLRYTFAKSVDVGARFGRDIFDEFNVYGLSWTPEEIIWWFGPSSDRMTEIFRSPTPRDVNGPMSVVINNQIGGTWARDPDPDADAETFSHGFEIDYVKVYALTPTNRVASGQSELRGGPDDDILVGTGTNQSFYPGAGFDILTAGDGADRFIIRGGAGSKMLTGFLSDDVVILQGWTFRSTEEALARLDQVGHDVWLVDAREPKVVQTLIFKNLRIGDLSAKNFDFGGDG